MEMKTIRNLIKFHLGYITAKNVSTYVSDLKLNEAGLKNNGIIILVEENSRELHSIISICVHIPLSIDENLRMIL
jgi:hypothetical protein